MNLKNSIQVNQPRPYQKVGIEFLVYGWVPVDWLETDHGRDPRICLKHFDIHAKLFGCETILIQPPKLFPNLRKKFFFGYKVRYTQISAHTILLSQGLLTIKISGHKKDQEIYIPICIQGFPQNGAHDPILVSLHANVEHKIKHFSDELDRYFWELDQLEQKRKEMTGEYGIQSDGTTVEDDELKLGVFKAIDLTDDEEKLALEEKYKEVLEWAGADAIRFGAGVGRLGGFDFQVYANDHNPKHFHVIHKSRGVNARFSFPGIKLLNYKEKKYSIKRNEEDAIRRYFQDEEHLKRLSIEFEKVDQHNKNTAL